MNLNQKTLLNNGYFFTSLTVFDSDSDSDSDSEEVKEISSSAKIKTSKMLPSTNSYSFMPNLL